MRKVSSSRYEQLRQIAADLIEDYEIVYPFDPYALAEKLHAEVIYYSESQLLRVIGMEALICDGGFSARFTNAGMQTYKIAVDEMHSSARQKFTVTHELAHIVLEHHGDSRDHEKLEQEANFFASYMLMPEIIGIRLFSAGDQEAVQEYCGVSAECAGLITQRIERRRAGSTAPRNSYEQQILAHFQSAAPF